MIQETDILEPLKLYNSCIKNDHHQNVTEFFDELVKKSGVSEEENDSLVKAVKDKTLKAAQAEKKLNGKKGTKTFLTVMFVVCLVAALICVCLCFAKKDLMALFIVIGVLLLGLGIFCLVWSLVNTKKVIQNLDNLYKKALEEKEKALAEALNQVAPLNALFDNNMPASLFSKTIPLIQMDQYFDKAKFQYLNEKYGFKENLEQNISSVYIQSGSILGNPFILERNYVQEMGRETYTGHLTISYTVTVPDGKGGYRRSVRTQTLTASVTKPKPYYYLDTWLVYSNDAAPKLHYSRVPSNANKMNDKEKEKFVHHFEKDLTKKAEAARKKGDTFTAMSNTEFEAFYNALNRDNEVEFRLLFTPLAQKNMIDLMTSKDPYGDDFEVIKDGPLNYVKTNHSQHFKYETGPETFKGYDIKEMRNRFVDFNDNYLKSFYFDMAPLMCVPLYQQHQTFEFIYEGKFATNLSSFETEILANQYGAKAFEHKDAATSSILKRTSVVANGKADKNIITAYSFKTIARIDYVPTLGGDGIMHNVPVHWIEYIPVSKETEFVSQEFRTSENKFNQNKANGLLDNIVSKYGINNAILYHRGLISFLASEMSANYNGEELNKLSLEDEKE